MVVSVHAALMPLWHGVRPVIFISLGTTQPSTGNETVGSETGSGDFSEVNYGEKTSSSVAQGDTISITFEKGKISEYTEQFMVLKKYENKIMAMPYYNLLLNSNPMKQAYPSTLSYAGGVAFSSESSPGWNADENIDMINVENNIQQYITAYSTKLSNATNGKVTAEVGRKYGDYKLTGIESSLLNPSGKGVFWLGTSGYSDQLVLFVTDTRRIC